LVIVLLLGKIAEGKVAARPITEKLQRRKKQQDPSRHGRRILQKGAVAFPNCRRFCSRTSYAAERHVTDGKTK